MKTTLKCLKYKVNIHITISVHFSSGVVRMLIQKAPRSAQFPSQALGGQAVVPRRLGYKSKSRKWHACSPSHYGQATCEDTAVSWVHSIKITAIMQVAKTPKPSTCCKRSHRVGFRDRRGQHHHRAQTKKRNIKQSPRAAQDVRRCYLRPLDPWEATILQIDRIMLTKVSSRTVLYQF